MTSSSDAQGPPDLIVIGPDGTPVAAAPATDLDPADRPAVAISDLVQQPAKVMRFGSMIKQLLDEVKAAPLDDAARSRLKSIHEQSVHELQDGLAPELVAELQRLSLPFADDVAPSDAELRIAQAQLVGWLEGLFHGIQAALFAQQMTAKAQFEEMRRQANMPGQLSPSPGQPGAGQYL